MAKSDLLSIGVIWLAGKAFIVSDTFYVEKDPKKIHQMIHSAARQLLLNINETGVDVSYSTCLDDVTLYYVGMNYGDFSREHSDVILGENNKGGHNEALS